MPQVKMYADIANLPEDRRIDLIGHRAIDHKKVVNFIVEDDAKANRYVQKLQAKFPTIRIIGRDLRLFGTVLLVVVSVGPPAEGQA